MALEVHSAGGASLIKMNNMTDDYVRLVRHIKGVGEKVSPRGRPTRECLDQTLIFQTIDTPMLPVGVGRSCRTALGAVEAIQLLGGFEDIGLVTRMSPMLLRYTEPETGKFWASYGNRIGIQLTEVVRKLRADPDTRQAHAMLWDPELDNQPGKNNYPCTLMLSFRIRYGKLELHTTMRSNDIWRGAAYDLFQFTQVQWTLAHLLGLEPGRYIHTAHSLHIYEDDFDRADRLHFRDPVPREEDAVLVPRGIYHEGQDGKMLLMKTHARLIAGGILPKHLLTDSSRWYQERLAAK